MDGDGELQRETVELFLQEYPKILARLRTALADRDAKTLEREVHSIKGATGNLGATAAYEAAFRLEQIGRAGSWGRAPDALTELELDLKRLEKILFGFRQQKENIQPSKQQNLQYPTFPPFLLTSLWWTNCARRARPCAGSYDARGSQTSDRSKTELALLKNLRILKRISSSRIGV